MYENVEIDYYAQKGTPSLSVLAKLTSLQLQIYTGRQVLTEVYTRLESWNLIRQSDTLTKGSYPSMPIAARKPVISRALVAFAAMGDSPSRATSVDKMFHQQKKLKGRAFYESIGSPKMVVAPMVDRSEFVGSCSLNSHRLLLTRFPGLEDAHAVFFGT
jgi:hypothetical protein